MVNILKKITFMSFYGVNFDSGIHISMEYIHVKEYDPPTKFYTSNLNFCVKTGISGPSIVRYAALFSSWTKNEFQKYVVL